MPRYKPQNQRNPAPGHIVCLSFRRADHPIWARATDLSEKDPLYRTSSNTPGCPTNMQQPPVLVNFQETYFLNRKQGQAEASVPYAQRSASCRGSNANNGGDRVPIRRSRMRIDLAARDVIHGVTNHGRDHRISNRARRLGADIGIIMHRKASSTTDAVAWHHRLRENIDDPLSICFRRIMIEAQASAPQRLAHAIGVNKIAHDTVANSKIAD